MAVMRLSDGSSNALSRRACASTSSTSSTNGTSAGSRPDGDLAGERDDVPDALLCEECDTNQDGVCDDCGRRACAVLQKCRTCPFMHPGECWARSDVTLRLG